MILPGPLRVQIIAHCLTSLPNEGCGLFAVEHDGIVKVYPTDNLDHSRHSFMVAPEEHLDALTDAVSHDWEIGGSFHSHPGGHAVPSDRDIAQALEPNWVYLVVGMRRADEVRGWTIMDGVATEVRLSDPSSSGRRRSHPGGRIRGRGGRPR